MNCPRHPRSYIYWDGEENVCLQCGWVEPDLPPESIMETLEQDRRYKHWKEPKPERIRKLKADTRRATDALIRRHVERLREE